jgi:hypothetical protein
MGKLDHATLANHRDRSGDGPLFDSLKQVWLSSLQLPDSSPASVPPDIIIVSEPPPARLLP